MTVYEYIIGGVLILAALLVIVVVLLQEGHEANVGVISGAADTFLDKGAAKTLDQKLAKWTKVIAIGFFVLVLGGMLVTKFLNKDALAAYEANKTSTSATASTSAEHKHDENCNHDHDKTTKATKATEGDKNTNDVELPF